MEDIICKLSPKSIYEEMSKVVVGQEEGKKQVAILLYLHFVRFIQDRENTNDIVLKRPIGLLMGPSGSGKTFLVREGVKAVKKILNYDVCPLLEIDCTQLTANGWVGDTLKDLLKNHHKKCTTKEQFESTVVFIDEFDKICKPAFGKEGTDHNKNTQYDFLKTIEGQDLESEYGRGIPHTMLPESKPVNTGKLLFIFGGNFSEIRHLRSAEKKIFGFTNNNQKVEYVDYHLEMEKIGVATQLIGRITHIGELQYLTEEELHKIMAIQVIPDMNELLLKSNIKKKFPKKAIKQIVKHAHIRKTGARGLYSKAYEAIEDIIFNAELKL